MENNSIECKKLNIDLMDYWMIIRKRFVSVLLIFIMVVIGTYLYTGTIQPEYQSSSKINLTLRQPTATIDGGLITLFSNKGNEIASEIKLIKNKTEILKSVLDVLQNGAECETMEKNKDFFSETNRRSRNFILDMDEHLGNNKRLSEYIESLTPADIGGMLQIEQMSQSNIVEIKVSNEYPEICQVIANTLAIVYNIDYWNRKITYAKSQLSFINDQLAKKEKEQKQNTVMIIETTEKDMFLGDATIYKQELTNMKIEFQKLSERYKDKHPRIIKLKKLIKNVETQLAMIPSTEQFLKATKAESSESAKFIRNLEGIKLKAEIDYDAKKGKVQDEIQIISWASGYSKIRPNLTMNMAVGVIFGIIIACLFAFVWEGLDTSIGKIEDVERITGLPVIAHIPLIGKKGRQGSFIRPVKIIWGLIFKSLIFFIPFIRKKERPLDLDKKVLFNFDAMSVTAEAYRTLRTNIQFAIGAGKATGNVIALTSTSPREGKTLTSTNLAISLAQMGKATLLIEADMRCPQIAGLFKINDKPGLSDLLIGTSNLDASVRTITDILIGDSEWDKLMEVQGLDNLNILPCGTIPPNPTELLISQEFPELIEKLRSRYDFIIVDTPPSLPVSDSSIVGTVVDGTIMIYQSDKTSRHLLLRAIQSLQKNKAKLLGVIINQLSFDVVIRSKSQYGYSYGYGYGNREES